MSQFNFYTLDSAPDGSKDLLEATQKQMGFLPNLYLGLAESPATLEAYLTLSKLLTKTSFTPAEQNLILLAISIENDCQYCAAAHSVGAKFAKLPGDVIDAVRRGQPIADDKLEALRRFAERLIQKRGFATDDLVEFLDAGFSQKQALEVVLAAAMKTLSNYANHLMDTPLDSALSDMAWTGKDDS